MTGDKISHAGRQAALECWEKYGTILLGQEHNHLLLLHGTFLLTRVATGHYCDTM